VVSTSFLWGFTPSWALLGSFNYSLENEGTVSELGGVQYSACCYAVRLLFYQYVVNNNPNTPNVLTGQMDRVIMVQFLLKGLGGVSTSGGQIQSLLAGIPGYNGQLGF
jgi:LPS-assembly protein